MEASAISTVLGDALFVALKISMPMLLLGMAVGVLIAIFQAVTQIHEQTLSFILKLIVVVAVLLIGGGWMLETLMEFTNGIFALIAA
jgi:flagellar biosynthetic protein FliQ